MDITAIASLATNLSQARTNQEIDMAVLRKALDMSASSAASLIAALPQPAAPRLPAHLGQNINTTA